MKNKQKIKKRIFKQLVADLCPATKEPIDNVLCEKCPYSGESWTTHKNPFKFTIRCVYEEKVLNNERNKR